MATIKDLLSAMISKINKAPKTVNGVEPDENGNITSSWNDLTDKPFGEEVSNVEINWDGDTTDLYRVDIAEDTSIYKVSDLTPTAEDLIGGTIIGSDGTVIPIVAQDIEYLEGAFRYKGGFFFVCYDPTNSFEGVTNNEVGTYFIEMRSSNLYVASLQSQTTTIKTLDPKYLPSGGSGGDNSLFVITGEFHATNQTGDYDVRHDQTYEEILEAYNDNKILVFCEKYEGEINAYFFLSTTGLSNSDTLLFYFTNVLCPAGTPVLVSVTIAPDNDSFMTETVLIAQ